ncbi:MAG: AfsR/SARP family transcriptional regulator [Micromonosporaceae bacterium]|nr:AfsR/SARP family transcriptional regulator [Micromonosporaceae bacterium]
MADVRVRLFGPIDVVVDGAPVALGHIKQRSVLAVLAMEPNRVVSREQLVDRVWDCRPPASVHNVLYGYLGKLRRVLAGCGLRLDRRPGGYLLDIDELLIDVHRFRRLVADSRGDGLGAESRLREALELWHGEPFAGVTSGWLVQVRRQLVDERLAAILDRNDLALRQGRAGHLLPELRALATSHPLNERLVGQLMLALHGSGLSWEALAVYADTRQRLAGEFGLDPSEALQHLERQILTGALGLIMPVGTGISGS